MCFYVLFIQYCKSFVKSGCCVCFTFLERNQEELNSFPFSFHLCQLQLNCIFFWCLLPMSSHALTWSTKPRSMMLWKVNSSVGLTSNSTAFESCSQCLSFIPSFLRAIARGRYGLYLSRSTLIVFPIFKITGMTFFSKEPNHFVYCFDVCWDLFFHIRCI